MSKSVLKKINKFISFKFALGILAVLGAVLVLVCAFALALPSLISSDYARTAITDRITQSTGKPATLQTLSFSWSRGLLVEGLRVGDSDQQAPGLHASLSHLRVDADILSVLHGTVGILVDVRGVRFKLELPPTTGAEQPADGAELSLSDKLRGVFSSLQVQLADSDLPVDLRASVRLDDIQGRIERPGAAAIDLRELTLAFDLPSIKAKPAELTAALTATSGGAPPLPLRLKATVARLCNASGRLSPSGAQLDLVLSAPGLDVLATGSLGSSLKVNLTARLTEMLAAVAPLSPAPLPRVQGSMALGLTLARPDAHRLTSSVVFFADGLRVEGGPLGTKSVGPLSFNLIQEKRLDLEAQSAAVSGSMDIQHAHAADWSGELSSMRKDKPVLRLKVTGLRLPLTRLLPAVRGFLPKGMALAAANLDADSVEVSAVLPEKQHTRPDLTAEISGLSAGARGLSLKQNGGALTLNNAALRLETVRAALPGSGDGQAEAQGTAKLSDLRLAGANPFRLAGADFSRLSVRVDGLAPDPAALFGVTGRPALELAASLRDLNAAGKAQAATVDLGLDVSAALPASQSAEAKLGALTVEAPGLRLSTGGGKSIDAPLTLRLTAPLIRLAGPAPLVPTMDKAEARIALGQALRGTAGLSLGGPRGRLVRSEGDLVLDAGRMLALANGFAPKNAKAEGRASVQWRMEAELPEQTQKSAATKPAKLSDTLKGLGFIHQAEATFSLDGLGLDWPLAPMPGQRAETLRLRGLSTPRPLRAATRGGLGESEAGGSLAFGPVDALPGVGVLAKPLRGLLTFKAAQQGARSAQISEVLRLDGMDVDQNLSLTLDHLDTVLDRDADRLAAALELLDATFSFRINAGVQPVRDGLSQGRKLASFTAKGGLEAGAEARLAGGRSLSISARLLSPGLDLTLGPDFALTGLASDVRIARRFRLSKGLRCPDEAAESILPLSEQVFDQLPTPALPRSTGEALGQLLRADAQSTGGTLSLARLKLISAGLPVDIRDVLLRIDTSGPTPGLRSFRAGVLGGNILGSALVREASGRHSLEASLAFTGIDPGKLLPAKARLESAQQAETSGRLNISLPLVTDPETLLQRLRLGADITKIGPRTLERMLYALDPDEQNQTIVEQRRLMGIGYPRHLRVRADYGNLSLSGAVDVKGFQLDLPQLDRLAIANLPLRDKLEKPLSQIPALIQALKAASATRICRSAAAKGQPAALRFVQTSTEQGATP